MKRGYISIGKVKERNETFRNVIFRSKNLFLLQGFFFDYFNKTMLSLFLLFLYLLFIQMMAPS